MWLALDHASGRAVQRNRRLGRIWRDREPAAYLEPFNLLHRNQMMENEPPEHTRLRRPVAAAFNRGHVERLRPRVRAIAPACSTRSTRPASTSSREYAEPLPVLVIAELLGVPAGLCPRCATGRRRSCGCTSRRRPQAVVDAAVRAADGLRGLRADLVAHRRERPGDDLVTDLAPATELSDDEVVASVVLLLNAGHEASVNVFGNGLVALLRRRVRDPRRAVPADGGGDAALRLGAPAVRAHGDRAGRGRRRDVQPGEKIAALLGSANRDPAVFAEPTRSSSTETPTRTWPSAWGCTSAWARRWRGWSWPSRCGALRRFPELGLAGEPVSRGTFVLRGYRAVPVAGV